LVLGRRELQEQVVQVAVAQVVQELKTAQVLQEQ
tara:strand:+ start:499 stop:600 length:102 start_codon:yes stop_codon:yes gene_type:complete